MTILGLDEVSVRSAVGRVRDNIDGGIAPLFARAAWTGITEPGDGVAGALIAALGPVGALELVIEHADGDRLSAELAAAGGTALAKRTLTQSLARWRPRLVSGDALASLDRAARLGIRFVTPDDPSWPRGLDELGEHAPLGLWVRGRHDALDELTRSIALVGARAATSYGENAAAELAEELVGRGFAIVSGGAYGIDGMAHRAALACDGTTIAFLAGGADRLYPPRNHELLTEIMRRGVVVSELPVGSTPTRWRFLQRNRLIAAASQATIVVEAGVRSGSINTAGHASALGRPLGVVPGPITSPASAGCHRLLREYSAVCVTRGDEAAELVDGAGVTAGRAEAPVDPVVTRVLDALTRRAQNASSVAKVSGLALAEVQAVLGLLELDGSVQSIDGAWRRA